MLLPSTNSKPFFYFMLKPGTLLISAPALEDVNFKQAVIFITEYNPKGAMGFVVNKRFWRSFNELVEYKQSIAFPLFKGGPVDTEHLFFLHQQPHSVTDGTPITNTIYMGGNFEQAVALINQQTLTSNNIKLFVGYCGWDNNELEEEIQEGSWLIAQADSSVIFLTDVNRLWDDLYNASSKR